jgi:PAS domain S-box-containing protein
VGVVPKANIGASELGTLFRLTDSLYRANTYPEIFEAALDAITSSLGNRGSILLFDHLGVMRFVAWRGLSADYRNALEGHTPWTPADVSPDPICVEDIAVSGESDQVRARIIAENIRGLAFIPIVSRRRVIGKFMTYFAEPHRFSAEEIELALTIARQLGFSIERKRAEEELRESEERFRLLSENAPVMLWMSDERGRCLHLNKMLREFWGVDNAALDAFDWSSTMHPDDRSLIEREMRNAIESKKPVTVEGRYLSAGREYRLLSTNAQPRFSAAGEFLGMIGVNVDVTERRGQELALKESEERLRVALAAGRMGTWRYDLRTGAQSWDRRQYELLGIEPGVTPTRDAFLARVHPEDARKVAFDPEALPPPGTFLDSEFRIVMHDGSIHWITAHSLARYDSHGAAIEMIGVNFDITRQKEAEDELRLLLAELNHRVKNTLAVVQAIAHQTFQDGGASEATLSAFEGRLVALSSAHDLLTQSKWESAGLRDIALNAFGGQSVGEAHFRLHGPNIELPPRQALALSLALHELCTNAIKYGALSNQTGRIDLAWSSASGGLQIEWVESGGPAVSPPARRGFGSRLIERALARDLDGVVTLDFDPSGVRCSMEARLGQP